MCSLISFQGQLWVKESLGSLPIARMKKGRNQSCNPSQRINCKLYKSLNMVCFITSFILFDIILPLEQSLEEPNVDQVECENLVMQSDSSVLEALSGTESPSDCIQSFSSDHPPSDDTPTSAIPDDM